MTKTKRQKDKKTKRQKDKKTKRQKDKKTKRQKDKQTQRQTVRKINDKEVWKRSGKFLCCVLIRHGGFNLTRKSLHKEDFVSKKV
jgi:hypothetical protein